MSKRFDPYSEWLNISPGNRPPDFYELLGLNKFESNEGLIKKAAKTRKRLLNEFISGERGRTAKSLIKEIAQAYHVLSQRKSKAAYDNRLRHLLSAGQTRTSFDTFVEAMPAMNPIDQPLSDATENGHEQEILMRPQRSNKTNQHRGFPIGTVLVCMGLVTLVAAIGLFVLITRLSVESAEPDEEQVLPALAQVESPGATAQAVVVTDTQAADDVEGEQQMTATDLPVKEPVVENSPTPLVAKSEVTAPNPAEVNAIAPSEMDRWKSMLGLTATLEGVVLKEGESSTGKTRYLWFATDRENNAMVFMLKRNIGDDLSLEYLRSLTGKQIRVTGVVETQFGTQRIGVKIQSQDQIEIVE